MPSDVIDFRNAESGPCASPAESTATLERFLEHISHELRGPLSVLKEFTSIILDGLAGEVAPTQREYLEMMAGGVDDLESMVNDLLDLGHLDSATIGPCRRCCRMVDIVDVVRTRLERKAALHHVRLEMDVAADLPAVFCDAEQIARVLTNLTNRAFRSCAAKGIVWVRVRRADNDATGIRCDVEDNGSGMPAEKLRLLQERFRSGDGSLSTGLSDLDLSLSVAVGLVELNLGAMRIVSPPGRGTAISFTLATADPSALVPRFLDQSVKSRGGLTHAALYVIRAEASTESAAIAEIGPFLHHHLRRWDMVLPIAPGAWLLLAPSATPDAGAMVRRLEKAWRETNAHRHHGGLPRLSFDRRGCWRMESQGRDLLAELARTLETERPGLGS